METTNPITHHIKAQRVQVNTPDGPVVTGEVVLFTAGSGIIVPAGPLADEIIEAFDL
jgi:hypothetical protein